MMEKDKSNLHMHEPPSDPDQQAIDWLLLLQENPDSTSLRQQIEQWLSESSENQKAWSRGQKAWQLVGHHEPDTTAWPTPRPVKTLGKPGVTIRSLRSATTTAIAACLLIVLWPMVQLHIAADYMTSAGETQTLTLSDGSVIHLGANSAISTTYSNALRHVELLSGQAHFQVTPDQERPFTVNTRNLEVTVLGTRFDVESGLNRSWVGVESGLVAIESETGQRQLVAGQLLSVPHAEGQSTLQQTLPETISSWRAQRLYIRNRSIGEAVNTLRRYYRGIIIITDAQLAEKPITGSYSLDNINSALNAMVQPHGGRILEVTPMLRIITRS